VSLPQQKTLSGTGPAASAKPDLRKALLGLAGFFLVFFTTHWLLLWLHPMGAHQFFWNLALGAGIFWRIRTRLRVIFWPGKARKSADNFDVQQMPH
jgi:hypothetical protein